MDLRVSALAVAMDGSLRPLSDATVTVGADAAKLALTVPKAVLGAQEILVFDWHDGNGNRLGQDHFAPRPHKSYDLQAPGLTYEIASGGGIWTLTLTAERLALYVAVEADCDGRFSDNALTVIPGQPVTVTFTPKDATQRPRFTIRDLHGATYGPQS